MLSLTYEYKAMPTNKQIQQINYTLTLSRKVGNFALRERSDWLNSRKCPINACSLVSEYITSAYAPYQNLIEADRPSSFKRWMKARKGFILSFPERELLFETKLKRSNRPSRTIEESAWIPPFVKNYGGKGTYRKLKICPIVATGGWL